jgi:hypothetical protein
MLPEEPSFRGARFGGHLWVPLGSYWGVSNLLKVVLFDKFLLLKPLSCTHHCAEFRFSLFEKSKEIE